MSDGSNQTIGKGNPPIGTRFKSGQSGNPNGRPRGKRRTLPYEAVLGQMVTIKENGVERQLPADQAFMLQLANRGFAGDDFSARETLKAIEGSRASGGQRRGLTVIMRVYPEPGDVSTPMRSLKMAELLDGFRATARIAIEPWLVQAALERLGNRRLSVAEQEIVVSSTRTPSKVLWPDWWSVHTF